MSISMGKDTPWSTMQSLFCLFPLLWRMQKLADSFNNPLSIDNILTRFDFCYSRYHAIVSALTIFEKTCKHKCKLSWEEAGMDKFSVERPKDLRMV